jgi:hypothetical protein
MAMPTEAQLEEAAEVANLMCKLIDWKKVGKKGGPTELEALSSAHKLAVQQLRSQGRIK